MPPDNKGDLPHTLIHLHNPKTAGSSLNALLASQFKMFEKMTLGDDSLGRLRSLPKVKKRKLKLLFGHMSYGVHRILPQECLYLFVLRLPGERLLSYYNYIGRKKEHLLHDAVKGNDLDFGSFLEYAAAGPRIRTAFDNAQLRRIAGNMTPSHLGDEKALLAQAFSNIFASNCIYGLTEDFNGFQRQLVARGLLPEENPIRLNAAPQKSSLDTAVTALTPRQRDLYNDFVRWDEMLYSVCRKLSYSGAEKLAR